MMKYWEILNLEPTKDIREIKRHYALLVKSSHPEDDPEGFAKLRDAYEYALNYARQRNLNIVESNLSENLHFEFTDMESSNIKNDFSSLVIMSSILENNESEESWQTFLNSQAFLTDIQAIDYQRSLYDFFVSNNCLSARQADLILASMKDVDPKYEPLFVYLVGLIRHLSNSYSEVESYVFEEEKADYSLFENMDSFDIVNEADLVLAEWIQLENKIYKLDSEKSWQEFLRSDKFQRVKDEKYFLEKLHIYLKNANRLTDEIENFVIIALELESAMCNDVERYAIAEIMLSQKRKKERKKIKRLTNLFLGIIVLLILKACGRI